MKKLLQVLDILGAKMLNMSCAIQSSINASRAKFSIQNCLIGPFELHDSLTYLAGQAGQRAQTVFTTVTGSDGVIHYNNCDNSTAHQSITGPGVMFLRQSRSCLHVNSRLMDYCFVPECCLMMSNVIINKEMVDVIFSIAMLF